MRRNGLADRTQRTIGAKGLAPRKPMRPNNLRPPLPEGPATVTFILSPEVHEEKNSRAARQAGRKKERGESDD